MVFMCPGRAPRCMQYAYREVAITCTSFSEALAAKKVYMCPGQAPKMAALEGVAVVVVVAMDASVAG